MLFHKPYFSTKAFSTKASPKSASPKWRIQLKQDQLVSQISTTLLQRHNWASLLLPLHLSSFLSPPIFLRILDRTQTNPRLSLTFFNWAKTNLGFKPDIKTLCKLTRILVGSGLARNSRPILDLLVQAYPPAQIVDSAIQACRGTEFQSPVLGIILECYCKKGFFLQGLDVYRKAINHGFVLSERSCNSLLDALLAESESRLAWCFYGNMLRNGILPDRSTWSLIAQILCKDGKFETIVRILAMGIHSSLIYNLVIDCYSKRGDFGAAFECLNEMCSRKISAGFSTYSSILDGACKFEDSKVIEMAMSLMVEKGLLSKLPLNCDLIIQKLSELRRTYAMNMFFDRACDEKIELKGASYGSMLKAFSREVRVKEACRIYHEIVARDVIVNDSCYSEFVNVLCNENPSKEISRLLKEIIGRGVAPCISKLSDFVTNQCAKGRWRDAEELLNAMLDKEFVPNSSCGSPLVVHYCSSKQINLAIDLHNKMQRVNGVLDITAYIVLLDGLLKERRLEEANKVFDYMRTREVMTGESFSIMIRGLCLDKELRKAMKLHDEMLKLRLKPDQKTYKLLISSFK